MKDWIAHLLAGSALGIWLSIGIEYWSGSPSFGLKAMLAGTADRPFIYRVLAPWLVNRLAVFLGTVSAMIAVEIGACILFSAAMWELSILVRRRQAAWAISMLGVLVLTWQMVHVYDAPVLALWAFCLLLMVRRQWRWVFPVFMLACLAKETALLMVPIFLCVAAGKMPIRRLLGMAVGLTAIWLVIRLAVTAAYRNNPGSIMEIHLGQQLRLLSSYAAVMALISFLLISSWSKQPAALRRAILVFPIFAGLFLLGGMPWEIRVFGEVYPVLILMLVQALPASPFSFSFGREALSHDQEAR